MPTSGIVYPFSRPYFMLLERYLTEQRDAPLYLRVTIQRML